MRVTITVEDVVREIEVRPDLLRPGMEEWQDATEVDLLVAFGAAYKQATSQRSQTLTAGETNEVALVVEPVADGAFAEPETSPEDEVAEPVTVPVAEYDPEADSGTAVAAALDVAPGDHPEDVAEAFSAPVDDVYVPVEDIYIPVEDIYVPAEPVAVEAAVEASEEEYAPADEQVTLSEDGFVPLDGDTDEHTDQESEAAPEQTQVASPCLCGHPRGWHVQESESDDYETAFGPCQMEWALDQKDPAFGRGRCSCLRYSPNVLPVVSD